MEIQLLEDIDEATLDMMSGWLYNWWGQAENYSLEAVKTYLRYGMQTQRLPMTFGCFDGDRLVGMYQLQWSDLFVRPDLYPWLANVYVDTAHRKCGYGGAMLKSVGAMLRRYTSFRECYLYTTHTALYEKYGWQFISEIDTYLSEQRMQRLYRLNTN
ncbi:MAG: GNAT family N-acetyltransferase [Proteobacteria bacterium]|nr:GNAT family N-acetyltransferase [Pseudomonadota bacterium]MBQ9242059.1 GNAT family N-acetyltransferase [Pseudomonadota bacterium]